MTTTTTTPNNDDDRGGAYGDKLIPEWRINADDQILLAGLAVVAAMLLAFGWSIWQGVGEELPTVASTVFDEEAEPDGNGGVPAAPMAADTDGDGDDGGDRIAGNVDEDEAVTTSSTTATTASSTSEIPETEIGDVQTAVDPFPGDINGTNSGTTAVLTGFVANDTERTEAEMAASTVAGIESVDNRLVVLRFPA